MNLFAKGYVLDRMAYFDFINIFAKLQVVQGMLQGHKDTFHTKASLLKLFIHECLRVYGDRMWDINDRMWLRV